MRFSSVCIESLGYVLPDRIVHSDDLEEWLRPVYERLRLPFGRLELMTGVRERRFFDKGTRPSDIAAKAGKMALSRARISRDDIRALFHTSVCRDFVEPATATVVHNHLGLPSDCTVFDLGNACLGFLNGMVMLGNMIELGQVKGGIIVSGEDGRDLVESTVRALNADERITRKSIKDQFASLTIGSAGVAAVLVHESIASDPTRRRLIGGTVRCATQHNNLCQGDSNGHGTLMHTNSEELLLRGVELAGDTWQQMCREMEWPGPDAIDKVIGHQVGSAHRRALFERLGLDTSREFSTFERLGNVGSAAAPITLAMADDAGFLTPGDTVGMLGIGSGINCLMLALKW